MPSIHALPPLPEYLQNLLQRVERETGSPVALREQELGGHDAEVHFASSEATVHEIIYAPAYAAYRLHFLVGSAWKALRFFAEPPDQTPEFLDGLARLLRDGLVRQVTSMPTDIRVEQDIYRELPEHRQEQHAYLRRQVRDLEQVVRPEMEAMLPDQLHAASVAMNWVFIREAAQLTDIHVPRAYRTTPYRRLGRRLQDQLHAVEEPAYVGDRNVADAWAKELKLEGWFQWM